MLHTLRSDAAPQQTPAAHAVPSEHVSLASSSTQPTHNKECCCCLQSEDISRATVRGLALRMRADFQQLVTADADAGRLLAVALELADVAVAAAGDWATTLQELQQVRITVRPLQC